MQGSCSPIYALQLLFALPSCSKTTSTKKHAKQLYYYIRVHSQVPEGTNRIEQRDPHMPATKECTCVVPSAGAAGQERDQKAGSSLETIKIS